MRTTGGGELRADNNVFTAGADDDAIQGNWAGSGNVFLNGAVSDSQSNGIFTPPYTYSPDPTGTSAEHQMLRNRLEANAGWQSVIFTPDGDFDFNGEVNGLDFLLWQRDPSVGLLSDWEANYGAPLTAASAAVPEPTTCALAIAAAIFFAAGRRRAKKRIWDLGVRIADS